MHSLVRLAIGAAAVAVHTVSAGPLRSGGNLVPRTVDGQEYACKCYPGDDCWPQQSAWDALDAEVNGNLHVHIPPEAACHNTFDGPFGSVETFDQEKCDDVTASWTDSQWT